MPSDAQFAGGSIDLTTNLQFGEDVGGTANEQFIGHADDLLVLRRAMPSHEIAQRAQSGFDDLGLLGIADIPLPHLEYLGLAGMGITLVEDIDLTQLPSLNHLQPNDNNIRDLSKLANMPVIDAGDAGYSELAGPWQENINPVSNAFDEDYRFRPVTGNEGALADWQFLDVPAGTYEVQVTWPATTAASTAVTYTVSSEDATTSIVQVSNPFNSISPTGGPTATTSGQTVTINTSAVTIVGDDADPNTFYGTPFTSQIAAGLTTIFVHGNLHIPDDTITIVGANALSIVVGNDAYIDPGAAFIASADGTTAGPGGGFPAGPAIGGNGTPTSGANTGGDGGDGGTNIGLIATGGANGDPGVRRFGDFGEDGFTSSASLGGFNNPLGGGDPGAGGRGGNGGLRGTNSFGGVGGDAGSFSGENAPDPGQPGGATDGGDGGDGFNAVTTGIFAPQPGEGGANSVTGPILAGGGAGGSGGGGGAGGSGRQAWVVVAVAVAASSFSTSTAGDGGNGGNGGDGGTGGDGGMGGRGGAGGGAFEIVTFGRLVVGNSTYEAHGGDGSAGTSAPTTGFNGPQGGAPGAQGSSGNTGTGSTGAVATAPTAVEVVTVDSARMERLEAEALAVPSSCSGPWRRSIWSTWIPKVVRGDLQHRPAARDDSSSAATRPCPAAVGT